MRTRFRSLIVACACAATWTVHAGTTPDDASTRPQDDLFQAVNGHWLATTPIPADKSGFGVWDIIADENDTRLRAIVDELTASKPAAGTVEQKVALIYRSYVDEKGIDQAGLASVQAALAAIDQITNRRQLAEYLGRQYGVISTPIAMWVDADFKDPTIYSATVWQDGLGLPDRDYYLQNDERFVKARAAYQVYLATLMKLAGLPDAEKAATAQLALEKRIAQAQWDKVRNRDTKKTYNPMTLAELARRAPGYDWKAYFDAAGIATVRPISVAQPSYAKAIAAMLASQPLSTWKTYAKLRVLDSAADVLPAAFRDADFQFHNMALRGQKEPRPRWKKGIAALDRSTGEALGQIYVQRHFPPANKARMQELVSQLLKAYGDSIDGLSWMTPATRAQAKIKLSKYTTKIGYPEKWRDYSALDVRDGDALGNQFRAARFEWDYNAAKVGRKVDRLEWGMTPQTVNAYYNPTMNEIVFPAAILQPPFFDMAADDATNYASIGAIIGHEISHGFDDQGSEFDGDGVLRNWWTPADRKAFEQLGSRLATQYDAYEPLPGKRVNGKLTLGENIADLSGLQIAYRAWRNTLGGKPAPVINGRTGEQRFFEAWAITWREKMRDERVLELVVRDPHSPPKFRANGAAVNHDGFHDAFGTKPGDGMYKAPADRIHIW